MDIAARITATPFGVIVELERDVAVAVAVEVAGEASGVAPDAWDHVAEASLAPPSGRLEIHACARGPVDVLVEPAGPYRVRVHYGGLDTLCEDGLDGDDDDRIALWPTPYAEVAELKPDVDPGIAP